MINHNYPAIVPLSHYHPILHLNHNWLVVSTPLKILVSWDYYSEYMESHKKMFQTTNRIILVVDEASNIWVNYNNSLT